MLDGVLERVTFANPETGYTIARIAPVKGEGEARKPSAGGADLVTAVGPLLGAQVGEFLRLRGRWSAHPRYGRQFEVHSYATVLPATAAGIQKYLGSGADQGHRAGDGRAHGGAFRRGHHARHRGRARPADRGRRAGPQAHRDDRRRLGRAEGDQGSDDLPPRRRRVDVAGGADLQEVRRRVGLVVRHEPYRLAADVWGIGFKTADTIAVAVGIAADSPERIKAGLAYTLSEAADDGHCYLPAPNLIADAAKILDVPAELIAPCLDELAAAEGVVRETVRTACRPGRGRTAGPRRLPAALLSGRTVRGARPAPPARCAG